MQEAKFCIFPLNKLCFLPKLRKMKLVFISCLLFILVSICHSLETEATSSQDYLSLEEESANPSVSILEADHDSKSKKRRERSKTQNGSKESRSSRRANQALMMKKIKSFEEKLVHIQHSLSTFKAELQDTKLRVVSISQKISRPIKGQKGDKGDEGWGRQGEQGPRGPIGMTGMKGMMGMQGPKGEQGSKGSMGSTGQSGLPGPRGLPGLDGNQGHRGFPGRMGIKGEQGLEGPAGPQGPRGPAGEQGRPGRMGDQGFPGTNGYCDMQECTTHMDRISFIQGRRMEDRLEDEFLARLKTLETHAGQLNIMLREGTLMVGKEEKARPENSVAESRQMQIETEVLNQEYEMTDSSDQIDSYEEPNYDNVESDDFSEEDGVENEINDDYNNVSLDSDEMLETTTVSPSLLETEEVGSGYEY